MIEEKLYLYCFNLITVTHCEQLRHKAQFWFVERGCCIRKFWTKINFQTIQGCFLSLQNPNSTWFFSDSNWTVLNCYYWSNKKHTSLKLGNTLIKQYIYPSLALHAHTGSILNESIHCLVLTVFTFQFMLVFSLWYYYHNFQSGVCTLMIVCYDCCVSDLKFLLHKAL
jgi:hypothetical protein